MKRILATLVAVMFLAGFTSLSFAVTTTMEEKAGGAPAGEMKGEKHDEMKGEMKGEAKGEMKGEQKAAAKGEKKKKEKK